MKEKDYVNVSNLAYIRGAKELLREIMVEDIAQSDLYSQIMKNLSKLQDSINNDILIDE